MRGRNALLALLLLAFLSNFAFLEARELRVVTFNAQNLFDGVDDGSEYGDYRSPGWQKLQYQKRLTAVGKALQGIASDAHILALQEVENAGVVQDLQKYYLPRQRYIAVSSEKRSAVQVALLTVYEIQAVKNHQLQVPGLRGLRPILDVIVNTPKLTHKKLQILVVHLKSKRKSSSRFSSDEIRNFQYELIAANISEKIPTILLGDYNDEEAYANISKKLLEKNKVNFISNPEAFYTEDSAEGSYFYRKWNMLDHIIFDELFEEYFDAIAIEAVSDKPFTRKYKSGQRPNSFSLRSRNFDAVSDHLPVLLIGQY